MGWCRCYHLRTQTVQSLIRAVLHVPLLRVYGSTAAYDGLHICRQPTCGSDPPFTGAACVFCGEVPAAGVPLPFLLSEEKQFPIAPDNQITLQLSCWGTAAGCLAFQLLLCSDWVIQSDRPAQKRRNPSFGADQGSQPDQQPTFTEATFD